MTAQPVGSGASYEQRKKARALTRVLTDLIELWQRYPKQLDKPVRLPTRVALAGFMEWAELLFGMDHPIATMIKYLGSVNDYDNAQVQERDLTQRDALEYATILRSLLRDWLEEESGAGVGEPRNLGLNRIASTLWLLRLKTKRQFVFAAQRSFSLD